MRTLVVGVDAACASVLEPMFADDLLPTLQRLFATGAAGPLESHVPPWTPSMWPSIYTGVNPGKHGVFSFLTYDGYDWELANASHVREHALWELLDHEGYESVVVNVPVTHPPGSFDGALVPGYTAPETPTCHPEGVLADVTDELGEYRIYAENAEDRDEVLAEYRTLTRMRGEAFRYLCAERDPQFGFLQFQQTDTVFHEQPGELDLVRGIYEAVDHELRRTITACEPDTVVVVSDHGMGEYDGYGVAVNELLDRNGYVETTERGAGMPSWVPIREQRLRDGSDADDAIDPGLAARALTVAERVGLTTRRVGAALERVGLRDAVAEVVPDRLIRAGQKQVDFAASTAYMRARIELGVRLNLEGREPDGVVPPEEYEDVRARLIDLLASIETPDGTPVFEEVAPREEYFHGPYAENAVDVITVPADYDHFLTAELSDEPFADPGQPWNHERTGVIAVAGAAVGDEPPAARVAGTGSPAARVDVTGSSAGDVAGNGSTAGAVVGDDGGSKPAVDDGSVFGTAGGDDSVADAHVFDVAPTVLATMGVPASDRMDGDVLPPVEPAGERSYPAYDGLEQRRPTGDVADRLDDLGYLNQ